MGWFDKKEDEEELMGPSIEGANLDVQYDRQSKDNAAELEKASKKADTKNYILNALSGLSGAMDGFSRSGKGNHDAKFYSDMKKENSDKVAGVKSAGDTKLGDLLTKDKIQRTDVERGQKDTKFKQENDENDALTVATSPRSKLYQDMARAKIREQARVAEAAGETDGAKQLRDMEATLADKSAADIGKMGLLDGSGYSALLNNKKADARAQYQDSAEARRVSAMKFNREETLRKQISSDPILKEAAKGKIGIDRAVSMVDRGSGVGDEALLMSWQKGMDPLSVVRESEFARTQTGQGVIAKIDMMIKQATGQGRLTPEIRKEILGAMRDLQGSYSKYAGSKLSTIDSAVREYALTPENVYGSFYTELAEPEQPVPNSQTATQPAAKSKPKTVVQGGVTYTLNEATGEYE